MITLLSALGSLLSFRVRRRASLELELVALRHQVIVLRRQRPGQLRLFSSDRMLWVWLYRICPQVLDAMVLVKPATVVQWPSPRPRPSARASLIVPKLLPDRLRHRYPTQRSCLASRPV